MTSSLVLVGDLGGTHVRLALALRSDNRIVLRDEIRFLSAEHADFAAIATDFLRGREQPTRACLAVAGPVHADPGSGQSSQLTNLPWRLEARRLERELGVSQVFLLNDFVAAALGILEIEARDVTAIGGPLRGDPTANLAVLGAGTGLGEAFVIRDGQRGIGVGGEGGHADFAPRTAREARLWAFLHTRHGHVSYERVLSGSGLVAIYDFLRAEGLPAHGGVEQERALGGDVAAAISKNAARDPTCAAALDTFCEIYGAEAGNHGLRVLAYGGVFLAGGIAAQIGKWLQRGGFYAAFLDKGRHRPLMERMPVGVVAHPSLGLLGAAAHALRA